VTLAWLTDRLEVLLPFFFNHLLLLSAPRLAADDGERSLKKKKEERRERKEEIQPEVKPLFRFDLIIFPSIHGGGQGKRKKF